MIDGGTGEAGEAGGGGEAGQAADSVFGKDLVYAVGGVVGARVGAESAQAAGPSDAGGGYRMDAAELQAVIGQWQDQLRQIMDDQHQIIQALGYLRAPGADSESCGYATDGMASLYRLLQQNKLMAAYAQDYIRKLTDAKNGTQAADEAAGHAVPKVV